MITGYEPIECPNCHRFYVPDLKRVDDRPVQQQYPSEPRWKREQLISGICSEECWNAFLGVGV